MGHPAGLVTTTAVGAVNNMTRILPAWAVGLAAPHCQRCTTTCTCSAKATTTNGDAVGEGSSFTTTTAPPEQPVDRATTTAEPQGELQSEKKAWTESRVVSTEGAEDRESGSSSECD
jgi:hypothetical protein